MHDNSAVAIEKPTPISLTELARSVGESVTAAYGTALMLQAAAEGDLARMRMENAAALLRAARDELEEAAREFIGERIERDKKNGT